MPRHLSIRNISSKSVHAFLSNLANRQTNTGENIYLLLCRKLKKVTKRRKIRDSPMRLGKRYGKIEKGGKVTQRWRGSGGNIRLSHLLMSFLYVDLLQFLASGHIINKKLLRKQVYRRRYESRRSPKPKPRAPERI